MSDYLAIRARVNQSHIAKIEQMKRQTGLTQSQLLRLMVEQAEVKGRPSVTVSLEKTNGYSVNTRQSHHATPVVG